MGKGKVQDGKWCMVYGYGIGTMLVAAIKNEILDKNRLPFYGTAMSHIASQRVALGAGFVPAWSELYCEAIER